MLIKNIKANDVSINKKIMLFNIIPFIFSFETLFLLFLFAGVYKADDRFAFIPVDLTLLFFILSMISGFFIIYQRDFEIKKNSFSLVLIGLIFVLYMLCSIIWSPGEVYKISKACRFSTLTFWSLFASSIIISHSTQRTKRFFVILLIFSILVGLEGLSVYLKSDGKSTVHAFNANYLAFGRVIGVGFIIVFTHMLFNIKKYFCQVLSLTILSFFIWLLLNSGGRGPFLSILIVIFIALIIGFRFTFNAKIIIKNYILYIVIFILILIILFSYLFLSGSTLVTIKRVSTIFIKEDMGSSIALRLQYYRSSFSLWMKNPIFGNGIGSWPILMGFGDKPGHPHNIFIEIAVELGLIGLLLFITLITFAIHKLSLHSHLRNNLLKMMIFLIFCFLFLRTLVSGEINDHRAFFAILGFMMFDGNGGKNIDEDCPSNFGT